MPSSTGGISSLLNYTDNLELRVCVPGRMPISGLRPEIGKKSPKNRFWPLPENREKSPKNRKNGPKTDFLSHFSYVWAIFSLFSGGEAKIDFSAIFFPISGWRPEIGILPGTHTRKPRGPNDQKNLISIEIFNLEIKFLISLENFNLDVSISPQNIGPRWVARSKISFSIEIFNLDRNLEFF